MTSPNRQSDRSRPRIPASIVVGLLICCIAVMTFSQGCGRSTPEVEPPTPQPKTAEPTVAQPTAAQPTTSKPTAEREATSAPETTTVSSTPPGPPSEITDERGHAMVLVPAGSFEMGGDATVALGECQEWLEPYWDYACKEDWFKAEEPIHTVTLADYYIDQYEVTNAQYASFLNQQGNQVEEGASWLDEEDDKGLLVQRGGEWKPKDGTSDHPVVSVNWYGARAYCQWRGARLPTEAEWEKAARGTDGRLYPWGNSLDPRNLNFCDQHCSIDWSNSDYDDGFPRSAPVGSYPGGASPYGLYDMAGNVGEWVDDWFDAHPGGDPESSEFFGQTHRVVRGGAWASSGESSRTARRDGREPARGTYAIGFRCARSPASQPAVEDHSDQAEPSTEIARVPLDSGGSIEIPHVALPEGTQIDINTTQPPLLPAGVEPVGEALEIKASADLLHPVTLRLPVPESISNPQQLVIVRVEPDGTTTFLMTRVEGDQLVAATPGFSTFAVAELTTPELQKRNVVLYGKSVLMAGEQVRYSILVAPWELLDGTTWEAWGDVSLGEHTSHSAIITANEEVSQSLTGVGFRCTDTVNGIDWYGYKEIFVVEDDGGRLEMNAFVEKDIVRPGEDTVVVGKVFGEFEAPLTWTWEPDDGTAWTQGSQSLREFTLPAWSYDSEGYYIGKITVEDANGRSSTAYVGLWVEDDHFMVELQGPRRLGYQAPSTLAAYSAIVSGGAQPLRNVTMMLSPGGDLRDLTSATAAGSGKATQNLAFKQPGEYLLNVTATDSMGAVASSSLSITVDGGEELSARIVDLSASAEPGDQVRILFTVRGGRLVVGGQKGPYRVEIDPGRGQPVVQAMGGGADITPYEGVAGAVFHTYEKAGVYKVTVDAYDSAGNHDSFSQEIEITEEARPEPEEEPPDADQDPEPSDTEPDEEQPDTVEDQDKEINDYCDLMPAGAEKCTCFDAGSTSFCEGLYWPGGGVVEIKISYYGNLDAAWWCQDQPDDVGFVEELGLGNCGFVLKRTINKQLVKGWRIEYAYDQVLVAVETRDEYPDNEVWMHAAAREIDDNFKRWIAERSQ